MKKFALLSAGSLTLSLTALACYGPHPYNRPDPMVTGLTFVDSGSSATMLANNQAVPVTARFVADFSTDMDTSIAAVTSLVDQNSVPTAHDASWVDAWTLSIIPTSNLLFSTEYTLKIIDAWDAQGVKLAITPAATAAFKTASA